MNHFRKQGTFFSAQILCLKIYKRFRWQDKKQNHKIHNNLQIFYTMAIFLVFRNSKKKKEEDVFKTLNLSILQFQFSFESSAHFSYFWCLKFGVSHLFSRWHSLFIPQLDSKLPSFGCKIYLLCQDIIDPIFSYSCYLF